MPGPNSNAIAIFTDNRSRLDEQMVYQLGRVIIDTAQGDTRPTTLGALADTLGIRRERLYRITRALGYAEHLDRILRRNRARAGYGPGGCH